MVAIEGDGFYLLAMAMMAAPFQWSLAALETLMAEDQMDQHAAVLRAFSVVELWRLDCVRLRGWVGCRYGRPNPYRACRGHPTLGCYPKPR